MKRNFIITAFLTIILVSSIVSIYKWNSEQNLNKFHQAFLQNCKNKLNNKFSEREKTSICNCSHDLMFKKYGSSVYGKDFVISTRSDSLDLIICLTNALGIDSTSNDDILKKLSPSSSD